VTSSAQQELFDVLIIGGGPVGGCAAGLFLTGSRGASRAMRIAVLEPTRPTAPLPDAPFDARVSTLSRASERILQAAGAWERMTLARVQPFERMRVWHESVAPASRDVLTFDAADAGEPNLGYVAENRLVQTAVLDAFTAAGGLIVPGELGGLRVEDTHVEAQTSAGVLGARLIVGADGSRSAVREAIGLTAETSSYGQIAIVANVATERSHEQCAWQRFLRTGTLAFLPLADGSSSIVWSADDAMADELLSADETEFARALERQSDGALGAMQLKTERLSFPLRRLAAHRYTASRCALIGDAAHVVHPLAGQGVNLGLLDAAALAQIVLEGWAAREDPGALGLLRRYERWRKSEAEVMRVAIDAFNRFLAHGSDPLSRLAQRGLAWVNRSQEVKRFFIARALGLAGELPRAARGDAATSARAAAGAIRSG